MAGTAAVCLLASGCATLLANQIRYAGSLPDCATGADARATLVRVSDQFSFAPSDGALIISGTVAADGTFAGTLIPEASRANRTGSPPAPVTLTVSGTLDNDAAKGTYVTHRCRTAFTLPRVGATLIP